MEIRISDSYPQGHATLNLTYERIVAAYYSILDELKTFLLKYYLQYTRVTLTIPTNDGRVISYNG